MYRLVSKIVLLGLLTPLASPADESALSDLKKAKAAHAKEMTRLRTKLLDDIDAVIKAEFDRGAGIDYLLKERKGFAEGGAVPILPKLRGVSHDYLAAKEAADKQLARAMATAAESLDKAGRKPEAERLRTELSELQPSPKPAPPLVGNKLTPVDPKPAPVEPKRSSGEPARPRVEPKPASVKTRVDLAGFLADTRWAWEKGGVVTLKADGAVSHPNWDGSGWQMKWEVVDRRTFRMTITKGSGTGGTATGRVALLRLSEDLSEFAGRDFDDSTIGPSKRQP